MSLKRECGKVVDLEFVAALVTQSGATRELR